MSVRRRFALWGTAVAAVVAAGVVSSLPASAAGGNTQDVFMSTGQATGLSPFANIYVGVGFVSLQGGTGQWVVQATATVVNWGPSDYYRCKLTDSYGTQLASGTSMVGSSTAPGNAGDGAIVAQITVSGVVNTFSGGNWVSFGCGHDRGSRDGLVDPGSTLWAHRSAELTNS
jgi:hypothetical protein